MGTACLTVPIESSAQTLGHSSSNLLEEGWLDATDESIFWDTRFAKKQC